MIVKGSVEPFKKREDACRPRSTKNISLTDVTSLGPDSSPQDQNDNRAETSPGYHLVNPCLN